VLLAAGCARPGLSQAEVSGRVTYRGRPLPGGVVTFVSARGLSGTAAIGADGSYQVRAPVGDVKVSVDNRMLRKAGRPAGYRVGSRPEGEGLHPLTGTYVPVPDKYASAETSGLTCHVAGGGQAFDIRLE
jgi:hypothetical protein